MENKQWKDKFIGKEINIDEFQLESDIDIYKLEKTGKYTFDDLIFAYNIEKQYPDRHFVVSAQIALKMLMPYVYRTLNKFDKTNSLNPTIKYNKENTRYDIILDCYLNLVNNAFRTLDMDRVLKTAKSPENMFSGYCKLYLKNVIMNYYRGEITKLYYDKGIRKAVPMSFYENEDSKKNANDRQVFFDENPLFNLVDEGIKFKEDEISDRLKICSIFAYVYNVKLKTKINTENSKMIDEIMNNPDISKQTKDDFIQLLHEKIMTSDKTVSIKKETKTFNKSKKSDNFVMSKLRESNPTYTFIFGYLNNLNNKQLDEFIEHFDVYNKMKDFCNTYEIPFPNLDPYAFEYEKKPTMWEKSISDNIDPLPSEKASIMKEISFEKQAAELDFEEEVAELEDM